MVICESLSQYDLHLILNEEDEELLEFSLFYELEEMAEVYSEDSSEEICFCCKGLLEPYWNDDDKGYDSEPEGSPS